MKQGTVSVLIGCHSIGHSVLVTLAWHKLYHRWPTPWQLGCILLHDIGHWGKDYLDHYSDKRKHAVLGAVVARRLFGRRGWDLVIGHNTYNGHPRSDLFTPDKYSWLIAPSCWLMSNRWFEPKLARPGLGVRDDIRQFKVALRENMEANFPEHGHEIYLRQCNRAKVE